MFYYPYQVRAIDICNPEHSFFVSKLNGITYELKREDEVQEVAYTDRNYRILLYPLECLTREFVVNGEKYDSDKIRVWICYEGIEDFG